MASLTLTKANMLHYLVSAITLSLTALLISGAFIEGAKMVKATYIYSSCGAVYFVMEQLRARAITLQPTRMPFVFAPDSETWGKALRWSLLIGALMVATITVGTQLNFRTAAGLGLIASLLFLLQVVVSLSMLAGYKHFAIPEDD